MDPRLDDLADSLPDDLADPLLADLVDLEAQALEFERFDDLEPLALVDLPDPRLPTAARRRAEALRARVERKGRFQSSALSARKLAGIASTPVGSSITASTAASARSLRTSAMTLDGRLARAACTRLVSRMTNMCRSGSIQSDVPVKPVCPKARSDKY